MWHSQEAKEGSEIRNCQEHLDGLRNPLVEEEEDVKHLILFPKQAFSLSSRRWG